MNIYLHTNKTVWGERMGLNKESQTWEQSLMLGGGGTSYQFWLGSKIGTNPTQVYGKGGHAEATL